MKQLITATVITILIGFLSACTAPNEARRILEQQGYTNIEIKGYSLLTCSEDDWFRTGFKATSPAGQQVQGVVCRGLFFKNSTIRFR